MTTRLFSFLGAGPLNETVYELDGQRCATCYMTDAAARFFRPDEVLVLVTKEAEERHLAQLQQRIADVYTPTPLRIPSGRSEDELWTIFTTIAQSIKPGDTLYFDVTNAFRSLPLLTFLIVAFVRVVRDAEVTRVVYGAYEARDTDNCSPVFDLTPFVRLLDWTTATDAFLRYGRADTLVPLVAHEPQFQPLATTLEQLTLALHTSRPGEVMQTAARLQREVVECIDRNQQGTRPFALLLDTIAREYGSFQHEAPTDPASAWLVVQRQLDMIRWYCEKGMYVQAITLAREWLISVVIAACGGDLFDYATREVANAAINGHRDALVRKKREKIRMEVPEPMRAIARRAILQDLWRATRDLRNDIGHTGMREQPEVAQDVVRRVREVCAMLPQALED